METSHRKGEPLQSSGPSPRIKEENALERPCADKSGADFPMRSEALGLASAEDSINSYRSVKEEADSITQGDLVYNPRTLLWIKRVDETSLTTDDDSEAKEPSQKRLQTGANIAEKVKRRPRFTASEEFVLVRELLEHYDKLFGTKAKITPFAQKVSIWQKVLENVNSVGFLQRGIEEAKKQWHLYKHRLLDKLVAMQKQVPGSGAERSMLARLSPLESKAANLFQLECVLTSSTQPSVAQQVPGRRSNMDIAGDSRKESLYAQNGASAEEGESDFTLSKAPRNIKFSFDENCALVHEAVGVWDNIIGRNAATTSQARKNFLWSRIVEAVNAAGVQPRSAENCKKRLRDIKRRVKAKMADQCKYSQHNGGGPCLEFQYLSYEEELMHVVGPDTVRPIEGHVDTDREPRSSTCPPPAHMGLSSYTGQKKEGKSEPEEENCYDDDLWNYSSFDMAEEDEEDDKEMVIKMEPINYSKDAPSPSSHSFPPPPPSLPPCSQPCIASQLLIASPKPIVANRPPLVPAKPVPASTKPVPPSTKPHPNNHPNSSLTAPNAASAGTINKVVGTLHTAQRYYHRSQRHQMHVLHMDLLRFGVSVQQLTRNVKVNNHIRATERARKFRLKQKDIEDQKQFRIEKLCLLRRHHETKLRILQEHYEKKEKLMHENNLLLKGILQRLSNPAGAVLAATCSTGEQSTSQILAASTPSDPSEPPQTSEKPPTTKGVRTRGGKGREGT